MVRHCVGSQKNGFVRSFSELLYRENTSISVRKVIIIVTLVA